MKRFINGLALCLLGVCLAFLLAACPTTSTSSSPTIKANAGADVTNAQVGTPITLDGSGSTGSKLNFNWSVASAPSGSIATISNPT